MGPLIPGLKAERRILFEKALPSSIGDTPHLSLQRKRLIPRIRRRDDHTVLCAHCGLFGPMQALVYLHLERKIHRDVKAGNILVAGDGSVRY